MNNPENLLCPMLTLKLGRRKVSKVIVPVCQGNKCAWWCDWAAACAMRAIALDMPISKSVVDE